LFSGRAPSELRFRCKQLMIFVHRSDQLEADPSLHCYWSIILFLRYLAEKFKKVLCVDSMQSSGQGDNKRAIGGVRATFASPGKIAVGMESIEVLRNWQQTTGSPLLAKCVIFCYFSSFPRQST
jgi:hypothetical protein